MTKTKTMPPTDNAQWGFWGTSERNGYDAAMAWQAGGDALATAFDLTPVEIRDLLDARFGRHLADDLSSIEGGPVSAEAIETHIMARLADRRWRRWVEQSVAELRSNQA